MTVNLLCNEWIRIVLMILHFYQNTVWNILAFLPSLYSPFRGFFFLLFDFWKVEPCSFLRCNDQRSHSWLTAFHEFLLHKDFIFQILWQCVPYSPLLTTSSDPVLFSVYFWDQTVFWSEGLPLSSFCWGCRWKRITGWHSVAPADRGSHGVSLAPCFLTCKSPHQWYKPEEVKRQRSAVIWPL